MAQHTISESICCRDVRHSLLSVFMHPLAHIQILILTLLESQREWGTPGAHNALVDDAGTINLPRFDGVKCEHILKGLRQPCGAERTNEDRVVCIHVYPCERVSSGERDQIQCFSKAVFGIRRRQRLHSENGPSFEIDNTTLEESTQMFPISRAALGHHRGRHLPTSGRHTRATGHCPAELPLALPLAVTWH